MSVSRHFSEMLMFLQRRITLLSGVTFLGNSDSERRVKGGDGVSILKTLSKFPTCHYSSSSPFFSVAPVIRNFGNPWFKFSILQTRGLLRSCVEET